MKLLLDTQVVLWQTAGTRPLGTQATAAIRAADELWCSAVSYAEIGVKSSIGKLRVPAGFEAELDSLGVRTLPLAARHGLAVAGLPLHHRDPFDRLLVAQAQLEGLTLVSADTLLAKYDVPLIDAST